ncbi:MAG: hypothetical protein QME05_01685 [Candidatus Margulisbacteria bacterium]|nr:hypothetical protein [Candidatus Margulisiibacteriota bacterium]
MTVRRVSEKDLRARMAAARGIEAPPIGISPILRAAWGFAKKMAHSFAKETENPEASTKGLLKTLVRKFT